MPPNEGIKKRIERKANTENLVESLTKLQATDLSSLLLYVFEERSKKRKPSEIMRDFENRQAFLGASEFTQEQLERFSLSCHSFISNEFEPVQLSPIAPFGLNSTLSPLSQNNTLTTIRNAEVISDPTSHLALECAYRRKKAKSNGEYSKEFHIATTSRVLRLQPFDSAKGYMQHFDLFGLCSGGKRQENDPMNIKHIRTHIDAILKILNGLQTQDYEFKNLTVMISDMRLLEALIAFKQFSRDTIVRNSLNEEFDLFDNLQINLPKTIEHTATLSDPNFLNQGLTSKHLKYLSKLEKELLEPLKQLYPGIKFGFDLNRKGGIGYYPNLSFHVFAETTDGRSVQLADGGNVDWLSELLQDKHEVMTISGLGSELIQKLFKK